jgi:NAD(P)-dependent dehydrogenase (short-subunit alcohol dehydrogenase family)
MGDNIFDLSGKVAVVTGGGSGLGRAFCEAMAEFGADVVCVGRTEKKIRETVEIISRYGHRAIAIKADISRQDDIERMVNETVRELGTIGIFFANAGIREISFVPIHEKPVEDWDAVMDTNLRSVFLQMRAVFPVMMKQKSGSFITISSAGGLWPLAQDKWVYTQTAYATAKSGLIMLTKLAARQYGEFNIRVNTICPGYHRTPLTPEAEVEQLEAMIVKLLPLGRPGMPHEIKGLAVWLASGASSFVTGQIFIEDGGYLA